MSETKYLCLPQCLHMTVIFCCFPVCHVEYTAQMQRPTKGEVENAGCPFYTKLHVTMTHHDNIVSIAGDRMSNSDHFLSDSYTHLSVTKARRGTPEPASSSFLTKYETLSLSLSATIRALSCAKACFNHGYKLG